MPSRALSRVFVPAIIGFAASVGLVACGDGRVQDQTGRGDAESAVLPYVVVNDNEVTGVPEGCAPTQVARQLHELFRELSMPESGLGLVSAERPVRGRAALTDLVRRFFGGEDTPFAWFSLNDRGMDDIPTIEAHSRSDLVSNLIKQPFRRLDLELTRVGPMRWVPERGNVALGLILFGAHEKETRERLGYGTGKGEYHCATSSFMVLSLMVHDELPPWAAGTPLSSVAGSAPYNGLQGPPNSP